MCIIALLVEIKAVLGGYFYFRFTYEKYGVSRWSDKLAPFHKNNFPLSNYSDYVQAVLHMRLSKGVVNGESSLLMGFKVWYDQFENVHA